MQRVGRNSEAYSASSCDAVGAIRGAYHRAALRADPLAIAPYEASRGRVGRNRYDALAGGFRPIGDCGEHFFMRELRMLS